MGSITITRSKSYSRQTIYDEQVNSAEKHADYEPEMPAAETSEFVEGDYFEKTALLPKK